MTANELTQDQEFEFQINEEKNGYPYVNVNIQNNQYEMLVDSGAEISAISTEYEETIMKKIA